MQFNIPEPMNLEHQELHHDLSLAVEAGGEVGAAAQRVAEALHVHFENEEKFALPPLGLLPALARGDVSPEMAEVLKMTDTLEAELPEMLAEHQIIVAALHQLVAAARQEDRPEFIHFAERLTLHAQTEEQVSYPTTILIGKYLKLALAV